MVTIKPIDESAISVQTLDQFSSHPAQVGILRLDSVHPLISGNKWFKLKYNIEAALQATKPCVATFGGAYSNHLIATASVAHQYGLSSFALVRGQEHAKKLNPVLSHCVTLGMQLHFVTRTQYALKDQAEQIAEWDRLVPNAYWIPEGGANEEGRRGASEMMQWIPKDTTHIILSVGSGTTFAGMSRGLLEGQHLLGFAPMKGGIYLNDVLSKWIAPQQSQHCVIIDRFHFGGFGKTNKELLDFMRTFQDQYGIELDKVYTAKMMLGLRQLLLESYFGTQAKIICIHTGGLTGN